MTVFSPTGFLSHRIHHLIFIYTYVPNDLYELDVFLWWYVVWFGSRFQNTISFYSVRANRRARSQIDSTAEARARRFDNNSLPNISAVKEEQSLTWKYLNMDQLIHTYRYLCIAFRHSRQFQCQFRPQHCDMLRVLLTALPPNWVCGGKLWRVCVRVICQRV